MGDDKLVVRIEVKGGIITDVQASQPTNVHLRDYDNLKEDGAANYQDAVWPVGEPPCQLANECPVCGWPQRGQTDCVCEVCSSEDAKRARGEAQNHFNQLAVGHLNKEELEHLKAMAETELKNRGVG